MDKSWMLQDRSHRSYIQGIFQFLRFVDQVTPRKKWHRCPCRKCMCDIWQTRKKMEEHLSHRGMWNNYTIWTEHGEVDETDSAQVELQNLHESGPSSNIADSSTNPTINLLHDVFPYASRYEMAAEEEGDDHATNVNEAIDNESPNINEGVDMSDYEKYNRLLAQAQIPLYDGCQVSVLSTIMSQMQLKVKHRTSIGHYEDLTEFIKTLLPKENRLPDTHYKTKKILGDLGLDYVKIHACKNNCVLFYGDYKDANYCPICNGSRYEDETSSKGKLVPVKVLRYFPLTPRLQRLYMSLETAKAMRWHSIRREDDGVLRHPSDGEAWKYFDASFPDFAEEVRNVRLGLAADGFNPSGNMTLSHSIWPVILMPYNLPPWMCMKKEYNFLTLLIPGPTSPGKCLDVYLRPLIDELKGLWENGIPTFDRHSQNAFRMRAVVMWTISDFPGYGMLSSHTTQGYKACPICLENVDASRHAGRTVYQGHRRWLPMNHEWRLDAQAFDGNEEHRQPPAVQSGFEVLEKLNSFDFGYLSSDTDVLARNPVRPTELENWHHKSIFFELPYWSTLKIRHNLDVMHIEKNVCDNVVGTILDIKDKTKDSIKARDDLQNMGLRRHLWVKRTGSRVEMPIAPYTVKPAVKPKVFGWLNVVKYPQGYAGNITRCVKVAEQKIHGLKSHDCHVLLQRLLPVVIRPYLHRDVVEPLVALSRFWQRLCSRELKKSDIVEMKSDIIYILCKLERIFPPTFFSIMVHLMIHLPDQVLLTGPVHYTWMFPIERQLGGYKGFVKNRSKPEGSIANAYIAHECVTYCNSYLNYIDSTEPMNVETVPMFNLSVVSQDLRLFGNLPKSYNLTEAELWEAHWWVLHHCDEVDQYKEIHLKSMQSKHTDGSAEEKHKRSFPAYFLRWVADLQKSNNSNYSTELHHLACKPQGYNVYAGCVVNGVKFLTIRRDQRRKTQNSGIMTVGKDKVAYYGIVIAVIELLYPAGMPVVVFKCRWFNTDPNVPRSTKMDYGLLSVNTSTSWFENSPFILATQAKQVFYLDDPKAGAGWKVVNVMEHRSIFNSITLNGGRIEQDIENVALEPYQESLTSDIPDTGTTRINNNLHFPQGEYIPISGIDLDFGPLPYIPPRNDFINDEDEDESSYSDEIPEDDLEDPDYEDSD